MKSSIEMILEDEIKKSTNIFNNALKDEVYTRVAEIDSYRSGLQQALEMIKTYQNQEKSAIKTQRQAYTKDGERVQYAIENGDFVFDVPVGYVLKKVKK